MEEVLEADDIDSTLEAMSESKNVLKIGLSVGDSSLGVSKYVPVDPKTCDTDSLSLMVFYY